MPVPAHVISFFSTFFLFYLRWERKKGDILGEGSEFSDCRFLKGARIGGIGQRSRESLRNQLIKIYTVRYDSFGTRVSV
jgi:hypothetical protein